MKKLFVLFIVVTMLTSGCAWFKKSSDVICNPTPEEQHTAALALAAIDAAQALVAGFYPAAGIIKASNILNSIKAGGCYVISELAEVFAVVDAANVAIDQVAIARMKVGKPVPPSMGMMRDYTPLRKYIKK